MTHLVCIERFYFSSDGIEIPADVVGEEAAFKDSERGRGLRLQERQRDRKCEVEIDGEMRQRTSGPCVSSLICAASERSDGAGGRRRDVETDRATLCGAVHHSDVRATRNVQKIPCLV